jgi:hypothetical protein
MSQADALLSKLHGVQGRGPRWRAICPAHDSKHNSRTLAVFETDDGRVLLRCHAGCEVAAIVGAVGMDLADLFPPRVDDDKRKPRVRKPWSARDVVAALEHECAVGVQLLNMLAAGAVIGTVNRQRAKVCAERFVALADELRRAS